MAGAILERATAHSSRAISIDEWYLWGYLVCVWEERLEVWVIL